MINFKSESANKTQQDNAKILFGSKGVSILAKLEEYSKEKQLDTAGIDALLDVLKTKDTALLEKFASSKTGKTLVTNCKQLAGAKTFAAIMKNIKSIKPLKSFDKFTGTATKKGIRGSATITKGGRKSKQLDLNSQDPSMFATALDLAGDSNSSAYKKAAKQITTQARKLGSIPRNMAVELSPYSVDTEGYFLEVYPAGASGDDLSDIHVVCLGGIDSKHPNAKKWAPLNGKVTVIEQVDFDDAGEVKRMDFAKALKYVVAKNK